MFSQLCPPLASLLVGNSPLSNQLIAQGGTLDLRSLTLFLAVAALVVYSVLLYFHARKLNSQVKHSKDDEQHEIVRLLSVAGSPAFMMDNEGRILRINDNAERFFGSSSLDFRGMKLSEVFPNSQLVFNQKENTYFHTEIKSRMEDMIPVNVRVQPLKFSTRYMAIMTIREPEHTETNQELLEVIQKSAHDFNNLLTGITGNLTLIGMHDELPQGLDECVAAAKRGAARAKALMEKLVAEANGEHVAPLPPMETPHNVTAMPGVLASAPVVSVTAAAPAPAKTSNPRILVLDDEEAICDLLSTVLNSIGCDVTSANTADQAIRACQDAVQSNRRFNLIISDLRLPGALTGEEVVKQLRLIDPNLKAMVSSGYSSDPIMVMHREHGFCAAIAKPYEIATLCRIVTEALAEKSSELKKFA